MGFFSALTTDGTKYKKIKAEGCLVEFSLEIGAKEATEFYTNALSRIKNDVRLPGYRPGKAPADLVKSYLGQTARSEALRDVMAKHLTDAVNELKFRLVDHPAIVSMEWPEGGALLVTLRGEVSPTPTAKDYLKIPVAKPKNDGVDAAVDKRIEELRQSHARLESVNEALTEAHFAVIDFVATRAGKPVPQGKATGQLIEMSAQQNVAGLTDGLRGLKQGDAKKISVKISGKDTDLNVTVREVKTKVLPPLDGEFAKDLGFETLDALRARIKDVVAVELKNQEQSEITRQIEAALVKANPFPLPPSMVEAQLDHLTERFTSQMVGVKRMGDAARAEIREKLRSRAEDDLRVHFIYNEIAVKEKLDPTDAEISAELEDQLKHTENDAQKSKLRAQFEQRKDEVRSALRARKTNAFLIERAVIS